MKRLTFALVALLLTAMGAQALPGCNMIGGWPAAQYGLPAQLMTDSLPCYGITGTRGTPVVLQTSPSIINTLTVTGTSSVALAVGRQGITQPAFTVNSSAASSITGIIVSSQSAGNGVNLNATGETNVSLTVNAAGNGNISFGTTSTGTIDNYRAVNFIAGVGTNYFGSSSGFTHVQSAATASGTLTLPAATDTLIGKATTDTLTNKTYNTQGTGNVFTLNGAAFGTEAQALAALHNPVQMYSAQVDLNTVADTAFTFTLPTGYTRYQINFIRVVNTSNTASLTTAQVGVFTSTGGGGTAIVTGGASLAAATTNAATTNAAVVQLTLAVGGTAYFTTNPIQFRVTTGQGAAANQATATVIMQIIPVS